MKVINQGSHDEDFDNEDESDDEGSDDDEDNNVKGGAGLVRQYSKGCEYRPGCQAASDVDSVQHCAERKLFRPQLVKQSCSSEQPQALAKEYGGR